LASLEGASNQGSFNRECRACQPKSRWFVITDSQSVNNYRGVVGQNLHDASAEPVSYEALYAAHHGEVLRLCRLLLANYHDAEEVAQEVFLKVHQKFQSMNETQLMLWRPWIVRVSVNACRDRRRSGWWKWWRGGNEEYREDIHETRGVNPEQALLSKETRTRVWRAFQELSGRQREVFALRYIDEWSTEKVAEMLGITTGSVKRYLFRAVRRLRRTLGDLR
jgi:RNA polymerase sigma-70 factor (ECF subfamily)